MLGKNAAHKESSQEKFHVHRANFNGRPKLPGCLGKDGAAAILGQVWLSQKGRLRKLVHVW
jgi:hypothetical protein